MRKLISRNTGIALFVIGMFCLFVRTSDQYIGWSKSQLATGRLVRTDAAGYYAYLPKWFIYHEQGFEFIRAVAKKYPKERFDDLTTKGSTEFADKFFPGTAVMLAPFFAVGHVHASIAGEDQDGYSWPYLFWMTIACAFYAAIGLLGLLLSGFRMGFSRYAVWVTVALIGVGTNFFFYATGEMPMSHIFSFCVNCWAVYSILQWKENGNAKWKILFAALLALAIIVRPLNVLLLVMLPFLFDSFPVFGKQLKQAFTKELRSTLIAIGCFLLVISIQLVNARQQLGYLGFSLYRTEGFDNWKDPYFWHSLFGFEKGMFVYSPVLLLIIPGLVVGFIRKRFLTSGILLFFVLTVYTCSAWWCWGYGGAFGLRALIDFYGIYALAIMLLLSQLKTTGKVIMCVPIGLLVWVYQLFDFQVRHDIIRYEHMDLKQLQYIFGKTDERFVFILERKRDTLSRSFHVEGEIAGMESPFTRKNVCEFDFDNQFPWERPKVKLYQADFRGLSGRFAYRMQTDVRLGGTASYLSMNTIGYSGGTEVFNYDNPFSQLPEEAEKWERISLDVKTGYPISQLDSVICYFTSGSTPAKIRKPVVLWGVEKQVIRYKRLYFKQLKNNIILCQPSKNNLRHDNILLCFLWVIPEISSRSHLQKSIDLCTIISKK